MLSPRGWAGLCLVLVGAAGLFAMRQLLAKGGASLLDRVDRLMSGGDRMIRLAAEVSLGDNPAQRLRLFVPTHPAHDPAITGRTLPVVTRLAGNNADYARSRFANFGCRIIECPDMWTAAAKAVAAAR